jgi:TadE-like protein
MSDYIERPSDHHAAQRSRRGQSLVEFGLVLPLLLVLFLGIADFGRVFHAGIVAEAAARNAAEIVAEEYRRNPPGISLSDPAPIPGNPDYYGALHDLGGLAACSEMRPLPSTTYDEASRECHLADADPGTHDWMPVVMVCIHDNADPLCADAAFGATIPDPECSALLAPISNAMEGGAEDSRYVEVRICYLFTTLVHLPILSIGDIWLQKDRVFTVADYPLPTPSIPPPPSAPDPEPLPSEEPSPSEDASHEPSASAEPEESLEPAPTPTPESTPAPPDPTPTPIPPAPTPNPNESPEPTP